MYEILQTVGDYQIRSEKIDYYKPDWFFPAFFIGSLGIVIVFFTITFQILGGELLQEWKYGSAILFLISATMVLATTMTYVDVCGVSITLINRQNNNAHSVDKFALSNDPDRDAKKIKSVVEEYTKLAQRLEEKQKEKEAAEQKLRHECCVRYNDVIQKVKQE